MNRSTMPRTVRCLRDSRNPAQVFTGAASRRPVHPERRAQAPTGADPANLGPATREPGDPVRAEAIDLLACLASQPEDWPWVLSVAPGRWNRAARSLAEAILNLIDYSDHSWRERYAEAEARLREVA